MIADLRVTADLAIANMTSTVVATRGNHLALVRGRYMRPDHGSDAYLAEVLNIVEINADNKIAAGVVFAFDELDAAVEELDARYLRGEASAHAHTWSVLTGAYGSINRHEEPPTATTWINLDHRRATSFAPGELIPYLHAAWESSPDDSYRIETVHRLTDHGAVVTHAANGTSRGGFDAEWRVIILFTIDGDLINRCEVFDEDDIDTAMARFEELQPQASRLNNAATHVGERFRAQFAARDWEAMAAMFASNFCMDDRRRVVNGGVRHGRDAQVEDLQTSAGIGINYMTFDVIATRGDRLMLGRGDAGNAERPGALEFDVLQVVEIDADELMTRVIMFDSDDIYAAFAELDARYLAGEAAAHAQTWSVLTQAYAALNRHEVPPTAPDWVDVDHRPLAPIGSGDLIAYIDTAIQDLKDLSFYAESVHRLTGLGAVATHVATGTSQEGFDAEWRMLGVMTVDGDVINGCEIFEEADLDAALARFDELTRLAPRLENLASQVQQRLWTYFEGRNWDAMAELITHDICTHDHRRVVNAGVQHGRDVEIGNMRALADVEAHVTLTIIATRGERLTLSRLHSSNRNLRHGEFGIELLNIIEIDTSNQIAAGALFDPEDIDAAFGELDSRYLAGEAAPYADTWSVITDVCAALNRRELPETTPDWVNLDHRRGGSFAPGDLTANIRATWDQTPDIGFQIAAVHRLTDSGAVITGAANGTSRDGFGAEWRQIDLLMLDGGKLDRCEMFDEPDLAAALARFDELHAHRPRLESAASRVLERFQTSFAARDWDALADVFAADYCLDDRRRVVNAGVRRGRDAAVEDLQVAADVGLLTNITSDVIATRGGRLVLTRLRASGRDHPAVQLDVLQVAECDADERIAADVVFDVDDVDAAYAELDARYLAGEAAPHADMWAEIAQSYAAMNRHENPATMSDWVTIDHRTRETFEGGDLSAYTRSAWELLPDIKIRIEAVHRLSDRGLVATHVAHRASQDGFEAEWRMIVLLLKQGESVNRCELFNEPDLDAALARFDELQSQPMRLENAASRVGARFSAYMAAPDWVAMAGMVAEDMCNDDRRPVVNAGVRRGREAEMANVRALVELGVTDTSPVVIATRGERLALSRIHLSGRYRRARGVPIRHTRHDRNRQRKPDRGPHMVRPRRHCRRLRRTRRPLPRRRGGNPCAHLVGRSERVRHAQLSTNSGYDAGLRQHRPSTRNRIRRRHSPLPRRHLGRFSRHHDVHRNSASAERSWSAGHLGVLWDGAERLHCGMAGDQHLDRRGRPDQRRRNL